MNQVKKSPILYKILWEMNISLVGLHLWRRAEERSCDPHRGQRAQGGYQCCQDKAGRRDQSRKLNLIQFAKDFKFPPQGS